MLIPINADYPEPRKIQRAVDALERGELIAYPTDTLYGIGCDIGNKRALDRLMALKRRASPRPPSFICHDMSDIARYAMVDDAVYRELKHLLPGPYTFVLLARPTVPKLLQSKRRTVGIRVPIHPIPLALARALGRPIASTSATYNDEVLIDSREVDDRFPGLALVLDGGVGGTVPTSIIDMTESPPVVLRQGAGPVAPFEESPPMSRRWIK
jgi:tRNA threonylcarbamoyl adenosine modification protein (Sua5/YciO/YrdC/YwlC family)